MTYKEFCESKANDPNVNIFPKPTTSDEAIDILADTILGTDWYISYPCRRGQANTEVVAAILKEYEYSKANERILTRILILVVIISLVCILGPMIIH
jgi:uncharacterized protein YggU (UPF0235/DUF167 family)